MALKLNPLLEKIILPHRLFLIFIFSVFFLPPAFVVLEDFNLIAAYETDAGSIISAIEDLFKPPYYDMLSGYHSKFYGWTYFAINFILLAPIKIFLSLIGSQSQFLVYFAIRIIFFALGLVSVLVFFEVVERLFKNSTLALVASLPYIFSLMCKFFYLLHPETTGNIFSLLGVLCLLDFIEKKNSCSYFLGLICLVLAALSKQVFLFICLPILFLFFHFYCVSCKKSYLKCFFSRDFGKIFLRTFLIAVAIFFAIHPYAFFKPALFMQFQLELIHQFANDASLSFQDSFKAWVNIIEEIPVIALAILLVPIQLAIALFLYFKRNQKYALLCIVNAISIPVILFLIVNSNRLIISANYLQPLYPFCLLSVVATLFFLVNSNNGVVKILSRIFSVYFVVLLLFCGIRNTAGELYFRIFFFKSSSSYQTYQYIKNNLTIKDKIAYDHFVALPSNMKGNGCHYWQGCGTDYIEEFRPNYVLLDEAFTFNNAPSEPTVRLQKYIFDHNFKLVTKIKTQNVQDGGAEISVYRKE